MRVQLDRSCPRMPIDNVDSAERPVKRVNAAGAWFVPICSSSKDAILQVPDRWLATEGERWRRRDR
jgi:hypothetical protein